MEKRKCIVCETEISGQRVLYCGNSCKQKQHYNKTKNESTTYVNQTIKSLRRKLELINDKGGKCCKCGYDKNLSALEFHHRDPYEKEGGLNMRLLSNRSVDYIKSESEKCDLLCANCHREHHNEDLEINKVIKLLEENEINVSKRNEKTNIGKPKCIDCNKEINYTYKRCVDCKCKNMRKVERPDLEFLEKELHIHGADWCSKKYNVAKRSIYRWIKNGIK